MRTHIMHDVLLNLRFLGKNKFFAASLQMRNAIEELVCSSAVFLSSRRQWSDFKCGRLTS